MSMLAERRRKQKWSLNPRGKDWSEDSNKFGQKLLEKMGWKVGKGLGAKEDGITEHVKVTYKNDSKGMGFKESENQWTEHDTNFQSLLENLNSSTGDIKVPDIEVGKKSLEEKSQKSRARVHYHKFTRGKDLSRYSEKDLANIFGKKSLEEKKVTQEENSLEKKDENGEAPSFGVQTVKGGTISEYFKKKLPSFGVFNNGLKVGSNGVLKKVEDDHSEDELPSFGFGFKQEKDAIDDKKKEDERPSFGLGFKQESSNNFDYGSTFVKAECVETNQDKKKKKKRKSTDNLEAPSKRSKPDIENPCFDDENSQEINEEIVENEYEVKRKEKKSKGKKRKQEESITEIDNPNFTLSSEEAIDNIEENQYEVKRKEKKTKKKQKTEESSVEIDNPNFTADQECIEENSVQENAFEVKRKDKSKKKKKENSTIDDVIDRNSSKSNLQNTPILKRMSPSSNRRSARKSVRFSEVNQEHIIPPNGYEEALTLEDLRNRNELFDINTQVIQDSLEEQQDENCVGFLNTAFDLKSIDQISFYERTYEKQISKKHRKKCETEDSIPGFVNEAFDLKIVDKTSFYEKTFEKELPKKKKKKKNDQGGLVNGIFSERTNRIEENLVTIAKEIENYQAEVENDINESKKKRKSD